MLYTVEFHSEQDNPAYLYMNGKSVQNFENGMELSEDIVQRLNEKCGEVIELKEQRDKFEKLINELRVQLDQKDDMLRSLAEDAPVEPKPIFEGDAVEALKAEVERLEEQNASLSAQLNVYDTGNMADLQEENKTLDRRVGELEVALSEANEARNELRKQASNSLNEIKRLRDKLAEANDSIKRMQVEHALFPDATVVPRHIAFNAPMKLDALKNTPIPESPTYTAAQVAALIKALGV